MEPLLKLFQEVFNEPVLDYQELPASASSRKYYRITSAFRSVIGTYSPDILESKAFISFSEHFSQLGLNVPDIFAVDPTMHLYLQQDLGDENLLQRIQKIKSGISDSGTLIGWYKKVIRALIPFQITGHKGMDYSQSVPRARFDFQSILWDLNHFKYYFLKLSGIPFSEQKLEEDFRMLSQFLDAGAKDSFMFRDFQSRNIMIYNNEPYFVDYQGGREGPLQYDLASLLYEAKTGLDSDTREELLDFYLSVLPEYRKVRSSQFRSDFNWWALIRVLQALGAYGLRGIIEKKALFLQSIPNGLANLEELTGRITEGPDLEELMQVLRRLTGLKDLYPSLPEQGIELTVTITSFSYRNNLPDDLSGNGGGFIYDCRFIENPGREPAFKQYTGLDKPVYEFLKSKPMANRFLKQVIEQVKDVIVTYREKGYTHLSVSFGCTGGQHRSVYMAHQLFEVLRNEEGVTVNEFHRELTMRK